MKLILIDIDVLCNELRDYDWKAFSSALRIVHSRATVTRDVAMLPWLYRCEPRLTPAKHEFLNKIATDCLIRSATDNHRNGSFRIQFLKKLKQPDTCITVVGAYPWKCMYVLTCLFGLTPYIDYLSSTDEHKDVRTMVCYCISRHDGIPVTNIHTYFARSDFMNVALNMRLNIECDVPDTWVAPVENKLRHTMVWNLTAVDLQTCEGWIWHVCNTVADFDVRLFVGVTDVQHQLLQGAVMMLTAKHTCVSFHTCQSSWQDVLEVCTEDKYCVMPCFVMDGVSKGIFGQDEAEIHNHMAQMLQSLTGKSDCCLFGNTLEDPACYAMTDISVKQVLLTDDVASLPNMLPVDRMHIWRNQTLLHDGVTEDTRSVSELVNACIKRRRSVAWAKILPT